MGKPQVSIHASLPNKKSSALESHKYQYIICIGDFALSANWGAVFPVKLVLRMSNIIRSARVHSIHACTGKTCSMELTSAKY
jgi:hypothetical protein